MTSLMLDLETLSTRPDAVILTFGAVKFDPYSDAISEESSFYTRIDVDEQIELGRHVEPVTIEWWGKQDPVVRDEALGDENRISVEEFTTKLNKFIVGCSEIWAHGASFDITIIENLYRNIGKPVPWNYWALRDSRTLFGVHGDPRERARVGYHNALSDCIYQARGVQEIYQKFNIQKGNTWN